MIRDWRFFVCFCGGFVCFCFWPATDPFHVKIQQPVNYQYLHKVRSAVLASASKHKTQKHGNLDKRGSDSFHNQQGRYECCVTCYHLGSSLHCWSLEKRIYAFMHSIQQSHKLSSKIIMKIFNGNPTSKTSTGRHPNCSTHPVMQSFMEIHQKDSNSMKSQKPPNNARHMSSVHLNKSGKL